jgi:5,6-dimethylbenzimidazole synthase
MNGVTIELPRFDRSFQQKLDVLIAWRRDVRRFSDRPVPQSLVDHLLDLAQLSPSVGNSQPWRWLRVDSAPKRAEIRANFVTCNENARRAMDEEHAALYGTLKLEGMDRAPLQFAVFCDRGTSQGLGLGRHTMHEMLEYSTVSMITTFWLAARAAGLGVGWVSILDPDAVSATLEVPAHWKFVAYLCVGWPEEEHLDPDLERLRWQRRTGVGREVRVV